MGAQWSRSSRSTSAWALTTRRPQRGTSPQRTAHHFDVAERGAVWWKGPGALVEPSFAPFAVGPLGCGELGCSELPLEGGR
eukprot:180686-Pyramimonas_sp.AAC.1